MSGPHRWHGARILFHKSQMANAKCPKPIPPLTPPFKSPIPSLHWAVAPSATVHVHLLSRGAQDPGTSRSYWATQIQQSMRLTISRLKTLCKVSLEHTGASEGVWSIPACNSLAAVPSTCCFLNLEVMLATEHVSLCWNHYTGVQLGARPLERCHAGLWKVLRIVASHAGLERKPIWKETKISFQRKALVVFPVSYIISKRFCWVKKTLTFGK